MPLPSREDTVPPALGETLEVTVEKLVFGGDGLARLPGGFVLFIPFTAVGDHALVRITHRKPHHAQAELVRLLTPSPEREEPHCPYYAQCGGCQYQHLSYVGELRAKTEQVRESFSRHARITDPPVRAIVSRPDGPYHYRNRITVHAEDGRLGFRALDGRTLIDVTRCALACPEVNAALAQLRAQKPSTGHYSVRDPSLPPSGFFQANHDLLEPLRDLVGQALPEQGDLLLEGYCGGGFFTQKLAPRFQRVVGIDNDPRTLRDARRLNLPQVEWIEADAGPAMASRLENHNTATVLLDPPREGLPSGLLAALLERPSAHLAYVSCDPVTLARDARRLQERYLLNWIQPIDLFPRTGQIECITSWTRRS